MKAPKEQDEAATASFREFREYSRGKLDVEHRDAYPWAGLVENERVRRVLAFMAESYEPGRLDGVDRRDMPSSFTDTEFFKSALKRFGTDAATRALRDGHIPTVSYMSGLPSYNADISGLHAINKLSDWLVNSQRCKLVYLAALMGKGKTDFSLTLLEIIDDHFRRLSKADEVGEHIPTPEFAANFEVSTDSEAHVEHLDNYDALMEWAERGSSDMTRWFIFDEASTNLTAQSGKNAQKVAEAMAPFVKRMRKLGVNMIIIGHDRGDIHVAIRSMADFVDKVSTKKATFYTGIENREPTGKLFDVGGIPPTAWEFDTDDMATWSWGSAFDDGDGALEENDGPDPKTLRNRRIVDLDERTELTKEEIGEAFDLSATWVRKILKKTDRGEVCSGG